MRVERFRKVAAALCAVSVLSWVAFATDDALLRIDRAVAPDHPTRVDAGGLVIAEIQVNRPGNRVQTTLHSGDHPFSTSALNALLQWRFSLPGEIENARTSLTFFFRPRSFRSVDLPQAVRANSPAQDSAPLPLKISDPGYPANETGNSIVILRLGVDENGKVVDVTPLNGNPKFLGRT
jgi:hypothetical protein